LEKEILKLTSEEARNIIYNQNKDYKEIKVEIYEKNRWLIYFEKIMQRISDNKFFSFCYSEGSGWQGEKNAYEGEDFIEAKEVFEKRITTYE